MTAEEKIARQRLSVLELAQALDNVSAACRQRGMSRPQFYEYKRRFQTHGLEGLKDLPPIHKSHPFTTPPEVVERILAENPDIVEGIRAGREKAMGFLVGQIMRATKGKANPQLVHKILKEKVGIP